MDFHPKDLPILKTYVLKDEKDASDAVKDMVKLGFKNRKEGFQLAESMSYNISLWMSLEGPLLEYYLLE
jgi:hypothetical protein